MDLNEYNGHIAQDPLWARDNLLDISLDQVKIAEESGQVRQAGTINSHIDNLEASISRHGQLVPITVEATADGTFVAADGNHRIKALRRLRDRIKNNPKYQNVRAHIRTFNSRAEKIQWQLSANDHPPAKRSSTSDVEYVVKKMMECESTDVPKELQGGYGNEMYLADPEKYQEVLKGYLEKATSLTSKERTRVARGVMMGFPNQKLRNYDTKELKKFFAEGNSIDWEIPAGLTRVFNGWRVETLGDSDYVFPNITGNSFKSKSENPEINTAVVLWDRNPFGKTGTKLDETRRKMISQINIANTSSLLKDGIRLVDRVFIAPQKIGSEIEEKGFFEITPAPDGKFGSDAFPNEGWKSP